MMNGVKKSNFLMKERISTKQAMPFIFKPGKWDCFDAYRIIIFCKPALRNRGHAF